jgi:hypothetical protein
VVASFQGALPLPQTFMKLLMKTGPYDPRLPDKTKYESLQMLTDYRSNPGINTGLFTILANEIKYDLSMIDKVYTSDFKRTRGTVDQLKKLGMINKNIKIITTPLLREIKFNMKKICDSYKYAELGSDGVRRGFIEAFINDYLEESRNKIQVRFKEFKKLIDESKDKNVLFVSHTFFIKLFLINQIESDFFDDPGKIRKFINPEQRIMEFLEIVDLEREIDKTKKLD